MKAVQEVRAATARDHERIDEAFGEFDLGDRGAYGRFLMAHAMALPAVENALRGVVEGGSFPALRWRTPLLGSDLHVLGVEEPELAVFRAPASPAEAFGMAYVIEGSRLGGGMLARQVPADFPKAYLSDTHQLGEWRGFLAAMETAAGGNPAWIADAAASARSTFALYGAAARVIGPVTPR